MSAVATRPVSVAELQRAYRATVAGAYRAGGVHRPVPVWRPEVPVVAVVGACAGAGASTLALALATAAGTASVVECASSTTSGLTAAATAEHGRDGSWVRGTRGPVTLVRSGVVLRGPDGVPVPPTGADLGAGPVVLDVAWDLGAVLACDGWLTTHLRASGPMVLVGPATVPGVRRLEAALYLLAGARPVVALVGPRRPARPVRAAVGDLTTAICRTGGRVLAVPFEARLAARGVDSTPLPPRLVRAAGRVLAAALPTGATP